MLCRFVCAVLACAALLATSASAQTVTQRMNTPVTIGNVGLANSPGVILASAQNATGLSTIYSNVNGFQNHYLTITTTGAPTYNVTLVGCYELTCAATNQTVNVVSSGSISTQPFVLTGGGFYPFLAMNVASLSGGTITVSYTGSVLASTRADPDGRGITGNSDRPGYHLNVSPTIPTAAGSLAAVEADGTNKLRLRYIKICLGVGALQTTATERELLLFKTTAASSGGSTATPVLYDPVDIAYAGIARSGALTTTPAAPTVANAIWSATFAFTTASTSTTPQCAEKYFDTGQMKGPTVNSAVANGFAIYDLSGGAGGAGVYNIDLAWTTEAN